jgi:hypothetical protein
MRTWATQAVSRSRPASAARILPIIARGPRLRQTCARCARRPDATRAAQDAPANNPVVEAPLPVPPRFAGPSLTARHHGASLANRPRPPNHPARRRGFAASFRAPPRHTTPPAPRCRGCPWSLPIFSDHPRTGSMIPRGTSIPHPPPTTALARGRAHFHPSHWRPAATARRRGTSIPLASRTTRLALGCWLDADGWTLVAGRHGPRARTVCRGHRTVPLCGSKEDTSHGRPRSGCPP